MAHTLGFFLTPSVGKKNEGIRARLPDDLRNRLDAIHEKHLTNDSTVVVRMLEAFCEHVEEAGGVNFPMRLVPATKASHPRKTA